MAYQPRSPKQGILHRLLAKNWKRFQEVYETRFLARFGPLRATLKEAVERFLRCADPKEGFARIKCATCGHERLLPFSCKTRNLCPSCSERRLLDWSSWVAREVLEPVAHRQVVLVFPKLLRPLISRSPQLFGALCRVFHEVIREAFAEVSGLAEAVPGAVICLQSHGNLLGPHPHLHALVSEGVFQPDGTFVPIRELSSQTLTELARRAVLEFLVEKKMLGEDLAAKMMTWRHAAGFSVDCSVRVSAEEVQAREPVEPLIRYLAHAPFTESKARLSADEATLVFTSKMNPMIGRNYEIFDSLEAIARILSLVPAKGWHTVRYFGWYSSKKRGMRKKGLHLGMKGIEPTRPRSVYRQAWAALIKKIWLEDPLVCEKCGGPMRVIAFIQDRTAIEKILRHLRLWEDPPAEAQPASRSPPEIEIVRVDEDGLSLDQTSPLPFDSILS